GKTDIPEDQNRYSPNRVDDDQPRHIPEMRMLRPRMQSGNTVTNLPMPIRVAAPSPNANLTQDSPVIPSRPVNMSGTRPERSRMRTGVSRELPCRVPSTMSA